MWTFLNEDPKGAILFSWVKVFAAVVLGLFLADGADVFAVDSTDLKTWLAAGFAAVLPIVINYVNPSDTRYGAGSEAQVDEPFDEGYQGE